MDIEYIILYTNMQCKYCLPLLQSKIKVENAVGSVWAGSMNRRLPLQRLVANGLFLKSFFSLNAVLIKLLALNRRSK